MAYGCDTLADDLQWVLDQNDLNDATLLGFVMGTAHGLSLSHAQAFNGALLACLGR